jgi:hypothetical protein
VAQVKVYADAEHPHKRAEAVRAMHKSSKREVA